MKARLSARSGFALILFSLCSLTHAAFIDPADSTGSFATDPGTWAANFPAMNANTAEPLEGITSTVRTTTPWTRGAANTTYQGWDRFTSSLNGPNVPNNAVTPNEVDADPDNAFGTATITQTVPGAFLTGGGNIYSPSSATTFSLAIPNANLGAGYQTSFLVQVRAATGDFDFSNFLVNGTALNLLANNSIQLIDKFTYDAGFGFTSALDYKIEFTLPSNSALDTITFESLETGLSFDKISVDTNVTAVPEPSSLILAGLFTAFGTILCRRRKTATQG